jgi:uncharacterized protein with NRDE domain
MCLIAFAWGASERFPFVVAANRDEFLARPTAPLSQWTSPGGATVVGGRDLKDGGTWMGFSPNGRFAMLTNVRDPKAAPTAQPISRGSLALAWLESDLTAHTWVETLDATRYQGFNLIVGDWQAKQSHYLTNQVFSGPFAKIAGIEYARVATDLIAINLPWGSVYGLSNAGLDTPWPKTMLLKGAVEKSLSNANAQALISHNLSILAEKSKPQDAQLPATGVPLELERALSSPFVAYPENAPNYGTRTSAVVVFEPTAGLHLTEVTHAFGAALAQTVSAKLDWS